MAPNQLRDLKLGSFCSVSSAECGWKSNLVWLLCKKNIVRETFLWLPFCSKLTKRLEIRVVWFRSRCRMWFYTKFSLVAMQKKKNCCLGNILMAAILLQINSETWNYIYLVQFQLISLFSVHKSFRNVPFILFQCGKKRQRGVDFALQLPQHCF